MAMKKRFYSVDGQMVGYEEGGVRKDFLTDHLGSVIAIMDENEVRVFDTRYSAYGRNRWITGTGCGFGWIGTYGYRETGLFHMSHYVRARHYSYVTGAWSTVDPLWPDESAYGYVSGESTSSVDASGLAPIFNESCNPFLGKVGDCCGKLMPALSFPKVLGILDCMDKLGFGKPKAAIFNALNNLVQICKPGSERPGSSAKGGNLCVWCSGGGNPSGWPASCGDTCPPNVNGTAVMPWVSPPGGLGRIGDTGCDAYWPGTNTSCLDALSNKGACDSAIVLCAPVLNGKDPLSPCLTLFHEIIHVGGVGHRGQMEGKRNDFVYALTCCMCKSVNPKGGCASRCSQFEVKRR